MAHWSGGNTKNKRKPPRIVVASYYSSPLRSGESVPEMTFLNIRLLPSQMKGNLFINKLNFLMLRLRVGTDTPQYTLHTHVIAMYTKFKIYNLFCMYLNCILPEIYILLHSVSPTGKVAITWQIN